MTIRADVCSECPFRRKSMPGWLGRNDPESFVANAALTDNSVACHLQVDQTLRRADWELAETTAPRCRGAITLQRNMCKIPRDRKQAELYRTVPADRESVFSRPAEFIDHHQSAKTKSWEL